MSLENSIWIKHNAHHIRPDDVEEMFTLARHMHPRAGCSELVGSRPLLKTDSVDQMAKYADVVTMKCRERLGWQAFRQEEHEKQKSQSRTGTGGRTGKMLPGGRFPQKSKVATTPSTFSATSIGNVAFIAKHHSLPAVRAWALAKIEQWRNLTPAPEVSQSKVPPLEPNECTWPPCGKPATMRCSVCKAASYCGLKCQEEDWEPHQKQCVAPKKKPPGFEDVEPKPITIGPFPAPSETKAVPAVPFSPSEATVGTGNGNGNGNGNGHGSSLATPSNTPRLVIGE